MLDKANRLRKDADFRKTFKFSRPVNVGRLSLRVAQNQKLLKLENPVSRFGIVISNKIDKRATRRNALRRQLRAIVRNLLPAFPHGYDVIIMVRECYNFPFVQAEIEKDLKDGLKKTGLLNSQISN